MLVSAGLVAYLGPFNNEFRKKILYNWEQFCILKNLPMDQNFDILR